jgi:hypothetical protein
MLGRCRRSSSQCALHLQPGSLGSGAAQAGSCLAAGARRWGHATAAAGRPGPRRSAGPAPRCTGAHAAGPRHAPAAAWRTCRPRRCPPRHPAAAGARARGRRWSGRRRTEAPPWAGAARRARQGGRLGWEAGRRQRQHNGSLAVPAAGSRPERRGGAAGAPARTLRRRRPSRAAARLGVAGRGQHLGGGAVVGQRVRLDHHGHVPAAAAAAAPRLRRPRELPGLAGLGAARGQGRVPAAGRRRRRRRRLSGKPLLTGPRGSSRRQPAR